MVQSRDLPSVGSSGSSGSSGGSGDVLFMEEPSENGKTAEILLEENDKDPGSGTGREDQEGVSDKQALKLTNGFAAAKSSAAADDYSFDADDYPDGAFDYLYHDPADETTEEATDNQKVADDDDTGPLVSPSNIASLTSLQLILLSPPLSLLPLSHYATP